MPSTVLLVDDDAALRRAVVRMLARLGVDVVEAVDGSDALAKLSQERFALVITDLDMPGVDGMTLLRAIRRAEPPPSVIVISGVGTFDDLVAARREGVVDFLPKPFEAETLRKVVGKRLGIPMPRPDAEEKE